MSDCTEWLWARNEDGYGFLRYQGRMVRAHRLSFCQANGLSLEDISGKVVLHKCDNPGCVNPDHLSVGTVQDNIDDMVAKGRQRGNTHQAGTSNHNYKHGRRCMKSEG